MARQERKTQTDEPTQPRPPPPSFARLHEQMVELATAVVEAAGLDLIEARLHGGRQGGRRVQLFVERWPGKGAVNIADCASVSRKLGATFELENAALADAALEVSSPGINRLLRHTADFERHAGIRARVTLREQVDADRETVIGVIASCDEQNLVLTLDNGSARSIPTDGIGRATLDPTHEQWIDLGQRLSAEGAEDAATMDEEQLSSEEEIVMSQGEDR